MLGRERVAFWSKMQRVPNFSRIISIVTFFFFIAMTSHLTLKQQSDRMKAELLDRYLILLHSTVFILNTYWILAMAALHNPHCCSEVSCKQRTPPIGSL